MTSANVVGYQNKAARNNFNYVTPTFRPIAGMTGADSNEISINEVQMDSSTGLGGADFQFLTDAAGMAVQYVWVPADQCESKGVTCPEGANGAWAVKYKSGITTKYRDPKGDDEEPNKMTVGYGVQVGTTEGHTVNFAGQVGEETVASMTRPARNNFNYFGNPFPTVISINNIQMDPSTGLGGADFQFLTDAAGMAVQYVWVPADQCESKGVTCPEGANGAWAVKYKSGITTKYRDPKGDDEEPNTVKAGECVQLGTTEGHTFYVLCPYDL